MARGAQQVQLRGRQDVLRRAAGQGGAGAWAYAAQRSTATAGPARRAAGCPAHGGGSRRYQVGQREQRAVHTPAAAVESASRGCTHPQLRTQVRVLCQLRLERAAEGHQPAPRGRRRQQLGPRQLAGACEVVAQCSNACVWARRAFMLPALQADAAAAAAEAGRGRRSGSGSSSASPALLVRSRTCSPQQLAQRVARPRGDVAPARQRLQPAVVAGVGAEHQQQGLLGDGGERR